MIVINTNVAQIPASDIAQIQTFDVSDKTYINPEMARIIIDQIVELKKRTELAEEQLNLLLVKNTD